jgi:hypothetical protein
MKIKWGGQFKQHTVITDNILLAFGINLSGRIILIPLSQGRVGFRDCMIISKTLQVDGKDKN